MKLLVVAIGHRMPAWVDAGFADYAGRMPPDARVTLVTPKPAPRGAPVERILTTEAERITAALPGRCVRVVLDERGTLLTTKDLSKRLERWRESGRDVAFVVGGADGLLGGMKASADFLWSLSPLTLPHGLARVALAEQLYRAVSILHNHPYHRD